MSPKPHRFGYQFSLLAVFAVVTAVCVFLASPSTACVVAASLPAVILGFACIQAALENQTAGWFSGLVFGVLIMAIGFAGVAVAMGMAVNE